jgi:tetratricopeptide (TPR) repeat protein
MIDESLDNLAGKAITLTHIGTIYEIQGNISKAIETYELALKINKKEGLIKNQAQCLNTVGVFYHRQGKYTKALENYEESLKIAEKLGDLSLKASLYNNMGKLYQDQSLTLPSSTKNRKIIMTL